MTYEEYISSISDEIELEMLLAELKEKISTLALRNKVNTEETSFKCTYEEYVLCFCPKCGNKDCPHREAFRRYPLSSGGLGLCPNLDIKK